MPAKLFLQNVILCLEAKYVIYQRIIDVIDDGCTADSNIPGCFSDCGGGCEPDIEDVPSDTVAHGYKIAWAGYVSPAGVSIGLTAVIAAEFQSWGTELASIIMAVIILNQLIGPPLLKWALIYVGESHVRPGSAFSANQGFSVLFGIENQSVALARQLKNNGWKVRLVSVGNSQDELASSDIETEKISEISRDTLKQVGADKAESIVAMLSDDENFRICEIAYENFGTIEMVVRLNQRNNFDRFHRLGAKIVEPSTAIISLLDHYVRSPRSV